MTSDDVKIIELLELDFEKDQAVFKIPNPSRWVAGTPQEAIQQGFKGVVS